MTKPYWVLCWALQGWNGEYNLDAGWKSPTGSSSTSPFGKKPKVLQKKNTHTQVPNMWNCVPCHLLPLPHISHTLHYICQFPQQDFLAIHIFLPHRILAPYPLDWDPALHLFNWFLPGTAGLCRTGSCSLYLGRYLGPCWEWAGYWESWLPDSISSPYTGLDPVAYELLPVFTRILQCIKPLGCLVLHPVLPFLFTFSFPL